MSTWGNRVDRWIDVAADKIGDKSFNGPGWKPIPGRPGLEGYWTGSEWDPRVPPRPAVDPMWKRAWPVFAGVVAALVLFAVLF